MAANSQKTVLITGCSDGGIGSALVTAFHNRGFKVFASARNVTKMSEVSSLPNVHPLQLDVTDQSSIEQAAEQLGQETGGKLDVLVNNAGSTYVMPALDSDLQTSRNMFEANFWGTVLATQAFSSSIIAAKGTIVNVCSINAYLNPPYQSVYNASKAAQESWSETLRIELKPLGVNVQTVITGVVKTQILAKTPSARLPERSWYQAAQTQIERRSKGGDVGNMPEPASKFAESMVGDVLGRVSSRTWRGGLGGTVRTLKVILPTWIKDYVLVKDTGLDSMARTGREA